MDKPHPVCSEGSAKQHHALTHPAAAFAVPETARRHSTTSQRSPPLGGPACTCSNNDRASLIAQCGSTLAQSQPLNLDDGPPARPRCKCPNCAPSLVHQAQTLESQQTLASQQQQPSLVTGSSSTTSAALNGNKQASLKEAAKEQQQPQAQQQEAQQQQQNAVVAHRPHLPLPIRIFVERRDDDSVRCDCRNCQFFSGWCCMPCALLIIIVIIVFWASSRFIGSSGGEHEHEHDHGHEVNKTLSNATTTTTTTTTRVPSSTRAISRTHFSPFDSFLAS